MRSSNVLPVARDAVREEPLHRRRPERPEALGLLLQPGPDHRSQVGNRRVRLEPGLLLQHRHHPAHPDRVRDEARVREGGQEVLCPAGGSPTPSGKAARTWDGPSGGGGRARRRRRRGRLVARRGPGEQEQRSAMPGSETRTGLDGEHSERCSTSRQHHVTPVPRGFLHDLACAQSLVGSGGSSARQLAARPGHPGQPRRDDGHPLPGPPLHPEPRLLGGSGRDGAGGLRGRLAPHLPVRRPARGPRGLAAHPHPVAVPRRAGVLGASAAPDAPPGPRGDGGALGESRRRCALPPSRW